MKLALKLAVLAIVVGVGAWMWLRSRDEQVTRAAVPTVLETRSNETVAREPEPLEVDSVTQPVAAETVEREATPARTLELEPEPQAGHRPLLRVRVVSKEHHSPIAGRHVYVKPATATEWSAGSVEGSHARANESPRTDSDGRATFEVEAGSALEVWDEENWGRAQTLPALTELEVREITLEVATEPDLTVFVRIVDAETKSPLRDAVVSVDAASKQSDSPVVDLHDDGLFELHVRSWREGIASASAAGYARVVFALYPGNETRERAREVRLPRAAALDVVVLDAGGAVSDAVVVLTTDAYRLEQDSVWIAAWSAEDPTWSGRTNAAGTAEISDLPPEVPLTLAVHASGREPYAESQPITLAPGERRRVEVSLGSGTSILGRVEDGPGVAVAGCEVWRAAPSLGSPPALMSYDDPVARTNSDEQGRFHFDDVASGEWLVGPKPLARWDDEAKQPDAIVGFAKLVRIEPGMPQVQVTLRIDRGLFLQGRVLGPNDELVPKCHVFAFTHDYAWTVSGQTDEAGSFAIGPVPDASYSLQAGGNGKYAGSPYVEARPADTDVVLRVPLGGSLTARALGADGQPRTSDFTLSRGDGETGLVMMQPSRELAPFDALEAGTYSLSACTHDGLFGQYPRIVLRAGENLGVVDVRLEAGARLRLRYEGEEAFASFSIFSDGKAVAADGVERRKDSIHVVPAGTVEVRWAQRSNGVKFVRSVTLTAGEERELVWDGKP